MSVKLGVGSKALNVVCAYAPQVGCTEEEKEEFWRHLDEEIQSISQEERVFLRGNLNGHIGAERGVMPRGHGGWGVEERNGEGESIIDFALANEIAIVNTFFKKTPDQYITYKSGARESQIDFLLCRRNHLGEVKNCKVIKGESVSAQHRLVVLDCGVKGAKRGKQRGVPKIKWWKLEEKQLKAQGYKTRLLREIEP
ncbi:uncharacterized protein LOC106478685 [Limulus polyphemus]|uniref:Uncharacterized protein LOC106478685 n=1 Tax=Limulus polyphemus TaxID=6850 RepID=A0ABM1C5R2_LIMPO|nr:uncharacterized protein LOC106478685 [Limulus polyphemus]